MNRRELALKVALRADLSDAAGEAAVKALFETLAEELSAGREVTIARFGVFKTRERPARMARNPRTGEVIQAPAGRSVVFRPNRALLDAKDA